MIIVVCNDDPAVGQLARYSQQQSPALGQVYLYSAIAPLAQGEDLFIIGHGVRKGRDNNAVIGDLAENGLSFNGVSLYEYLRQAGLFAQWTRGRVFILTCESLDHDYDAFSFAEVFNNVVAPNRQVQVYGRHDNTIRQIPAPGAAGWVLVNF